MKGSLLCSAVAFGAIPAAAFAQDEVSRSGGHAWESEIVVTAQKRTENLQDVPISIVAMGTEGLEKRGITSITDLGSTVPDLQVVAHPNSATSQRIFIRGVGANDDQFTLDPAVAVYVDGVYVARSQGLSADTAEIERIEVLRGPQGTLYGRNATGGAVNVITKAPELGKFRAKQAVSVGNYGQFRSHTLVNVPIGDALALQLAYLRSEKNGFVDNIGTGVKRFGDQRRDSYRAAVRWEPTDHIAINYAYDRSEISDTPIFLAGVPLYPAKAARPNQGSVYVQDLKPNDVTVQGHSLTVSFNLNDNLTLKSITGYRKLSNFTYMDYHSGIYAPNSFLISSFDQKHKQFSEELQLVGQTAGESLSYILGLYYFDEKADSFDTSRLLLMNWADRNVRIHNKAYAAFGQATWRLPFEDRLSVTAGLRYSSDDRKAVMDQWRRSPAGVISGITPTGYAKRKFDNLAPYFSLAFKPTRDLNLYAKWTRGYKSGGFNTRASSIARFEEGFGEENNTVIEVGAKAELLDRRLRLNGAVFRGRYKDIQVNIQSNPNDPNITDLLNAGRANISGFEFDVTIQPTDALQLVVNYSYLDAQYKKVITAAGTDISKTVAFVGAPKHTLVASAQYQFPSTPIGALSAFVETSIQDKRFGTALSRSYVIPSYTLVNARLTLSEIPLGFGKWQASLFGKNLTNSNYYLSYVSAGVPTAQFGDPRSYGFEVKVEF